MDKYRFRCYDPELKMMSKPFGFTSSVLNFNDKHFKGFDENKHIICQFYMSLNTWKTEPETIDSYEGDVIEVERYNPGEFYYVYIKDIRNRPENLFGSFVVSRKLLGNIYENPELIEKYKLNIN